MTDNSKKYGLIIPKKGERKKAILARPSIFGDIDDDEDSDPAIQNKAVKKVGTDSVLKRKTQLEIDQALEEDPNVYEYDAIYDQMQEEKKALIPGLQKKDKDKKPKYIENLLKTAELRKKEHERRVERQVQKEREAENGQYDDSESFVTGAYRKKMQEMAEEEEREKQLAKKEAKEDVTKQTDMSAFYRNLLSETARQPDEPTSVKEEKNDSEPVERINDPKEDPSPSSGSSNYKQKSPEHHKNKSEPSHSRKKDLETERNHRNKHKKDRDSEKHRHKEKKRNHDDGRGRQRDAPYEYVDPYDRRGRSDRHPPKGPLGNATEKSQSIPEQYSEKVGTAVDKDSQIHSEAEDKKRTQSKDADLDARAVEIASKFCKHTVGESVDSARARYLARKQGQHIAIAHEQEEEDNNV